MFGYDLHQQLDEIRPTYHFDESCQGTVPPAITAFLESSDYEDAIRKAVSLGGDADTLACITGGIAVEALELKGDGSVKVKLASKTMARRIIIEQTGKLKAPLESGVSALARALRGDLGLEDDDA